VSRLLVVRLYRTGQHYDSLKSIQDELGSIVVELRPPNSRTSSIPFLSLGTVFSPGREILAEGESALTGKWMVEQMERDGDEEDGEKDMVRRLVFLRYPFMVQSEVGVVKQRRGAKKKGKARTRLMTEKLSFAYHRAMLTALRYLEIKSRGIDS